MLGSVEIVSVVAETLSARSSLPWERGEAALLPQGEGGPKGRMRAFLVYDPVMTASSGDALSGSGFVEAVRHALLPLVDCLTPNLAEAAAATWGAACAKPIRHGAPGRSIVEARAEAVLMKGGHLEGDETVDLLVTENAVRRFAAPRLASQNLHGTGCTLSSAIAANIVLGAPLPQAVAAARAFVRQAIERGQDVTLGAGAGPLIQSQLRSKL